MKTGLTKRQRPCRDYDSFLQRRARPLCALRDARNRLRDNQAFESCLT